MSTEYDTMSSKTAVISQTITGATQANPVVLTITGTTLVNGDLIYITGVVGMVEINGRWFTVANKATNTVELSGEDGTGHTAYSSGGTCNPIRHLVNSTSPNTTDGEYSLLLNVSNMERGDRVEIVPYAKVLDGDAQGQLMEYPLTNEQVNDAFQTPWHSMYHAWDWRFAQTDGVARAFTGSIRQA